MSKHYRPIHILTHTFHHFFIKPASCRKLHVKIIYLEMCERSADSDCALQGDGNGRVDRAHHGHVDEAKQEGDQVGEENSLKC